MKALTIWQPWASLIMAGAKPYEFRGWRAPRSLIGQRIVIHAAARPVDEEAVSNLYYVMKFCGECDSIAREAQETCLFPAKAVEVFEQHLPAYGGKGLPIGAGLGTALLGEPRNGIEIAEEFGVPRANDSERDDHANWGWPLTDIEIWDEPIPMKGKQGFWNWPEPKDFGL
ncbi:MAG: ASCH domain-containing protein [Proteobacteria bacterium]|nr:ASCH domain-containing protein [Pseudomonadota bacterium]